MIGEIGVDTSQTLALIIVGAAKYRNFLAGILIRKISRGAVRALSCNG
jgi:hypothetical protein